MPNGTAFLRAGKDPMGSYCFRIECGQDLTNVIIDLKQNQHRLYLYLNGHIFK